MLFLGSDGISAICLKALAKHETVSKIEVVSPSKATVLAEAAKSMQLQVLSPSTPHSKMLDWDLFQPTSDFWTKQFDFMVVASFGYFIPEKVLQHVPATLNMHPSLLPRHRGASPIQFSILSQDRKTGVSIIDLHPKAFDKGKVILQEELNSVDMGSATYAELAERLAELGGKMLVRAMEEYGNIVPVEQDEQLATKAPKLSPEVGQLKCSESSNAIYLKFRALFGTSIRPSFSFRGKLILPQKLRKVSNAEAEALSVRYPLAVPGSLWVLFPALGKEVKAKAAFLKQIDPVIFLRTADGWLALTEFIRAGKPFTKTTLTEFISSNLPQSRFQQPSPILGSDVSFD